MSGNPIARLRVVDTKEIFSFGITNSPQVTVENLLGGEAVGIVRGVVAEFINGDVWKVTGFLDEPGDVHDALYQTSRHRRFNVRLMRPIPDWLSPFDDVSFCRAAAAGSSIGGPIDLGESLIMDDGVVATRVSG